MVRGPSREGPAIRASSRAKRHPQASASGDVATIGRATAADRTGTRAPLASGADRQTAAAPDAR
eukprot:3317401-Alexandrium_andersonii.AAC.1